MISTTVQGVLKVRNADSDEYRYPGSLPVANVIVDIHRQDPSRKQTATEE
jgi:hypothetical protein